MSKGINRALAIKELQDIVDFSQKQMLDYLNGESYKEQLFRHITVKDKKQNKRPTVATNLTLKKADSIKNTSDIDKCALLLEYAYRRVFQRPCHNLRPIELFLALFQEAINYKYNDVYDEDFISEIRNQSDARYKDDENFKDKEFELYTREVAEKKFNWFAEHSNRFKNYFEITAKPKFCITGSIISEDVNASLEEIVFPTKQASWTHNVSLCGKGGSGKTYQFLNLINTILKDKKYHEIIPLYVELNDITNNDNNCITVLLSTYFNVSIDAITSVLNTHNNEVIIFCDGLNEVTDGNVRAEIADSICKLVTSYKTRIVLSSRDDHSSLFNYSGFKDEQKFITASVPALSPEQIKSYFLSREIHVDYDKLSLSTQKLLETAQGLSMYSELITNDSHLEFHNLRELLQSYADKILRIDRTNQSDCYDKFESQLKAAAYNMALLGVFQISINELKSIPGSENIEKYIANNRVATIFAPDATGKYQFSHHNFRDLYCSAFLADTIKGIWSHNIQEKKAFFRKLRETIIKYLQNNYVNESPDIIEMCSSLLTSEDIQNVINVIKECPKEGMDFDYPLSLLIKLYALINDNSIATLDLSNLDLANISLVNYSLYSMEDENKYVKLNNSTISENTFSGNGLQSASSTLCRYELDEKEYIAVFSATNILIYDITENSWNCIRNLENRGWVNCCCVIYDNGTVSIYLGCETGDIKVFEPSKLTVSLIHENKGDRECGIETLIPLYNNKTIIYSDAYGNVFSLQGEEISQIRKTEKDELEHARIIFQTKSKEIFDKYLVFDKELGLISRLTLSKNKKFLYLSFGNNIYRYEMPLDKDKKFELYKSYNDDTIIRDIIYTSKGILINKITEISFLSDRGYESKAFKVKDPEALEYFTKFSQTEDDNNALIGVSARYSDYTKISNFFIVYHKKTAKRVEGKGIARGLHTKTTYTGAVFKLPGIGNNKYKIATVADDRAVQFLSHNDENLETIIHRGCYDGVRNISFISDDQVLLAQYDGSISYWRKEDDQWQCHRVYRTHNDWVWAVKHVGSNQNLGIFSCSFDGTLRQTHAVTGETITLIDGTRMESMIDLSAIENGNYIASITEKKVFWCSTKGKRQLLQPPIAIPQNWTNYILRSVDCIDNKLFIALKATLTDGTEQCYLMSSNDGRISKILDCEKTCGFIRGIKTYNLCGKSLLVIYGHNKGEQYFSFYFYEDASLIYKGSIFPDETHSKKLKITIDLLSSKDPKAYKMITDIAVRTNTASYKNKALSFELYVIHRNRQFRAYNISIGSNQTAISEMIDVPDLTIDQAPSQPLCIGICNDTIAVGQLNGKVTTNILGNKKAKPINFVTHADLNACVSIDIENAKFKNAEAEESFRKTFEGYFTF